MVCNKKFIYLGFSVSQILVILIDFFINLKVSLLSYINISFYVAFFLLMLSLTIYTIQSGYFDSVVASFKRVSKINNRNIGDKDTEIERPYSEVISFSQLPILMIGILNALMCGLALFIYFKFA